MNSKTTGVVIFVAGATVGVVATWLTLKTKYEQIARDEIDAVKEVYYNRKDSVKKNTDIIKEQGYIAVEKPEIEENEEEVEDIMGPYVISPDEFDTLGYETRSLDYYSDDVLVDEFEEVVDDVEDLIGDGLQHFGEYEDDSVFVRDDRTQTDYEILRDSRPYSEEI